MKNRFFLELPLLSILISTFLIVGACTSFHSAARDEYWPTKGWRTSKPEKQRMDSGKLRELNGYVQNELPHITSITVIRNGYIVFEEYFKGDQEKLRTLYSATKSVVSTLIGILIREEKVESVDEKILDYLPESMTKDVSSGARELTIKHLLTMTSGLPFGFASIFENDLSSTILSEALITKPGEYFAYTQANSDFLSAILTETSGLKASQFAAEILFVPLGIKNHLWLDYKNYSPGSHGLQLKPRDMAKIGYLYLKKGMWENKQLIDRSYVEEAVTGHIGVPPEGNIWDIKDLHYGYHWWGWPVKGYDAYAAVGGFSGEYVMCVLPDMEMIVVITAEGSATDLLNPQYINPLPIIGDYILEAVVEE